MRSTRNAFALFTLLLMGASPVAARENPKQVEAYQQRDALIVRAYESGDPAAVAEVLALKLSPEAFRFRIGAQWRVALMLEKAGRLREARDLLADIVERQPDADAAWDLDRVMRAMEPAPPISAAKNLMRRFPETAELYPALLGEPARREAEFEAAIKAAGERKSSTARTMLQVMRGDLELARGDAKAALVSYLWVEDLWPSPAMRLREAQVYLALGRPDDARYMITKFEKCPERERSINPHLLERLAPIASALEQHSRARALEDTLARRRAWEASPPPAGYDPVRAIMACGWEDTTTFLGDKEYDVKGIVLYRTDEDRALKTWLVEGWEAVAVPVRGLLKARVGITPADLLMHWDPSRQAFIWKLEAKEWPAAEPRLILHANGAVYVGEDRFFTTRGWYMSPGQAPFVGPCTFGLPMTRALAVTREIEAREVEGGMVLVRAELGGGGEYIGTAARTEAGLVPTGYGRFIRPGLGTFVGRIDSGKPDRGGFIRADLGLEVVAFDMTCMLEVGGHRYGADTYFSPSVSTPYPQMRYGDRFEYLDVNTAYYLSFDPKTGEYREGINEEWREELRQSAEAARQRLESSRQYDEIQKREAAYRAADEEAAKEARIEAARSGTFQFMAPSRNDRCIRCRGTGQLWVGSTVTQGFKYDELSKETRDTSTHTSGHMEKCHWCDGTGKR